MPEESQTTPNNRLQRLSKSDGLPECALRILNYELSIGELLREIRIEYKLRTGCAREIRALYGAPIDPSYLGRMERGRASIPLRSLLAILDFYKVRPSEFFARLDAKRSMPDERSAQHLLLFMESVRLMIHEYIKTPVSNESARAHKDYLKLASGMLNELNSLLLELDEEEQD